MINTHAILVRCIIGEILNDGLDITVGVHVNGLEEGHIHVADFKANP